MGSGTRAAGGAHAALIDDMKDQLLLVLIQRLGGKVSIPVSEIDGTGDRLCMMRVDPSGVFHFEITRKQ